MKKSVVINGMKIEMDVTAWVKWENRAKREGVPVGALLSKALNG